MERPFSIGDCIAREKFISEVPPSFLPILDIEGEINMVSNYKGNTEDNLPPQKMRAIGLERYWLSLCFTRLIIYHFNFHNIHGRLQPSI